MARKKDYKVSDLRSAQVTLASAASEKTSPSVTDAYVDMTALLGPKARFASDQRALDLRKWLGRGIDPWVFTCGFCIKRMLLSGRYTTASVTTYFGNSQHFFEYMIDGAKTFAIATPKSPSELLPLHIQHFVGWLQKRAQAKALRPISVRCFYNAVKAIVIEMFSQGFIRGEVSHFFPRGMVSWRCGQSRQTSLSDAEQARVASAIKLDLIDVHHGRSMLAESAVQGLRLLLVAHRQGLNLTPLLEMRRDGISPGILPGTIRIPTAKHRSKRVRSGSGRAAHTDREDAQNPERQDEKDLIFDLSEGAVLQQAIACSRHLVPEASEAFQKRIWLYRVSSKRPSIRNSVTCLTESVLLLTIRGLVQRHNLRADDGRPLRLNLSRLRKSFFDRALRAANGDMAVTANLMGNTPRVADSYYPSMNDARKAEAAEFMNGDYVAMIRAKTPPEQRTQLNPVVVLPFKISKKHSDASSPTPTPVSSCRDSINGEHAPHDNHSHCDRFVMCLFCSSFAIIGSVDELWRLFSFQVFARSELDHLNENLGPERTTDDLLEDLRDRYRVAIPYIDDFTQRQFARSRIAQARAKTLSDLHPFWKYQMTLSRRARSAAPTRESIIEKTQHVDTMTGEGHE